MNSVMTLPAFLPSEQITVKSSSQVLGDSGFDNILQVSFKPQTQLAPNGAGKIEIGIPYQWQVGLQTSQMYDGDQANQCFSDCMQITSSLLQGNLINIKYTGMLAECTKGIFEILIQCRYFKNPVFQDVWYGFFVNFYDNERTPKAIEKSDLTPALNTRAYHPKLLTARDFRLKPEENTIDTFSEWSITLQPGIPMMHECYIRLQFPPELQLKLDSIEAQGIFLPKSQQSILTPGDFDFELKSSQITLFGCFDQNSLGSDPSGRLFIRSIKTQSSIRDSSPFKLDIFKDADQQQLIASLEPEFRLRAQDLRQGTLTNVKLSPLLLQVQTTTLLYVNFTTSHALPKHAKVVIEMPGSLTLPTGETEVIGLINDSNTPEKSTYQTKALINRQFVVISNFTDSVKPAPYTFWFILTQITNQQACRDAGAFIITTQDAGGHIIDSSLLKESYVATQGKIDGNILIMDRTCSKKTNYTLQISTESLVPAGGWVKIEFPSEIQMTDLTPAKGSCQSFNCSIEGNLLWLELKDAVKGSFKLWLVEILNPRSLEPTSLFRISTFDTDGQTVIDTGFNQNVQMLYPSPFRSFELARSTEQNSQISDYTFSIGAYMIAGDVLHFTLPKQVGTSAAKCQNADCQISGSQVTLRLAASQDFIQFTLSNVTNPVSTQTSDPIIDIKITCNGYVVSTFDSKITVTNSEPALVTDYNLVQSSLFPSESASYQLQFVPRGSIPDSAVIRLKWPEMILASSPLQCMIITSKVQSGACLVNYAQRTILISNVFQNAYQAQITIQLANFTNPADNRFVNSFELETYSDSTQEYIMDRLPADSLVPQLQCDYPCKTCHSDNRKDCTSCYLDSQQKFLMSLTSQRGMCLSECSRGFTFNDSPSKECTRCGKSCATCQNSGQVGDELRCTSCAADHPFKYGDKCLKVCSQGLFLPSTSIDQCSKCSHNCLTCSEVAEQCTSCNASSPNRNFHKHECLTECPYGFTAVGGICQPCQPPCQSCTESQTHCTRCDINAAESILLGSKCYDECPSGFVTDRAELKCLECSVGCKLCNVTNASQCVECMEGVSIFDGVCLSRCPDGFKALRGRCVVGSEQDMKLLWFPFLISAAVISLIVLSGRLKKKASLVDGNLKFISQQSSPTCLIASLAPMQSLTCFLQASLALQQSYPLHFALALIVSLTIIAMNIAFVTWFYLSFIRTVLPKIGSQVIYKRRVIYVTEQTRQKLLQHPDPLFSQFTQKHKCVTTIILVLSLLNLNTISIFWSKFYSFDMFKAQFTHQQKLKQKYYKFNFAYMVLVDLILVAISIVGTLQLPFNSQLSITMTETLVLSISLLLLKWFARGKLMAVQPASRVEAMSGYRQRLKLKYLLFKVKGSPLFKDRLLADLIEMFGKRKCESMQDLHGYCERDPRETKSWGASPNSGLIQKFQQFNAVEFSKYMDFGHGVENPEHDQAVGRKQAYLMAAQEQEGAQTDYRSKKRKRGRRNKYQNFMDMEEERDSPHQDADEYLDLLKLQTIEEKKLELMIKQAEDEYKLQLNHSSSEHQQSVSQRSLLQKTEILANAQLSQGGEKLRKGFDGSQQLPRKTKQLAKEQKQSKTDQKKRAKSKGEIRNLGSLQLDRQGDRCDVDDKALMVFMGPAKPQAGLRTFNENDILGDFDRDNKGQLMIKSTHDKQQRKVNKKGYLIDKDDNIIAQEGQIMFQSNELLADGEVKAPFWFERLNFNVHQVYGNFDTDSQRKIILRKEQKSLFDKNGKQVNHQGFYCNKAGDITDSQGRKKIDRFWLNQEGLRLWTLDNRQFSVLDCIGTFDKDTDGIPFLASVDKRGRKCNEQGYLVDGCGNIVTCEGEILFDYQTLQSGEFIKIIDRQIDLSRLKADDGTWRKDSQGNICDKVGIVVIGKCMMDEQGEIPLVFRQNAESEMSKLLDEINQIHVEASEAGFKNETSVDTLQEIMTKKLGHKLETTVLIPSQREIERANCYNGQAKIKKRKLKSSQIEDKSGPKNTAQLNILQKQGKNLVEQKQNPRQFKPTLTHDSDYNRKIQEFLDDSQWDIESFDKITLSDYDSKEQGHHLTAAATLEQLYLPKVVSSPARQTSYLLQRETMTSVVDDAQMMRTGQQTIQKK